MKNPRPELDSTSALLHLAEAPECVVIGYNEVPFTTYAEQILGFGEDSEVVRDLKFSYLEHAGKLLTYLDLMNIALHRSRHGTGPAPEFFKSGDIPSLAAVYLTNFLRKRDISASFINLFQHEKAELAEYLSGNPLCVAITTTLYTINLPVLEIVQFIRQHNPNVKIIVGGPLIANHFRRHLGDDLAIPLADIGADIYVNESQGEQTLADLVLALRQGNDLRDVHNLAFFDGNALVRTQPRPENNDLDLNAIDWKGFPDQNLGFTIQTRTARSCAFKCEFCAYPMRAGKLSLANLDTIEKELDAMASLGQVENVVFIDDTFNVPLPRFKKICRLMIERDYGLKWFSYFRCSNSDPEAIELMARSGCQGVFLGIESGSPTILKNMNKVATVEKYHQAIRLLHEHEILTFGSFILGFPGETAETVQETIDFIEEAQFDYYRIQLWYCEHGTPITARRDEFDLVGDGFKWRHRTMDSQEAMTLVEDAFRKIRGSIWMPQWSFDFWFIPSVLGAGLTLQQFRDMMRSAHNMLRLDFDGLPPHRRLVKQHQHLKEMSRGATEWNIRDPASLASTHSTRQVARA